MLFYLVCFLIVVEFNQNAYNLMAKKYKVLIAELIHFSKMIKKYIFFIKLQNACILNI